MRRKAFTLIELLVVVAIIALLISILLPSLARARELSKRTVCMANLKGVGTAFAVYASDYADSWPIAPHTAPPSPPAGNTPLTTAVTYIAANPFNRGVAELTAISTTRTFWWLVRDNATAPGQFICPSSDDQKNNDADPMQAWDFYSYDECSYGVQVPYGALARPSGDRDPAMPLGADKGPFGKVIWKGATVNWASITSDTPDLWRAGQSFNHGQSGDGEGQNVLFADTHCEFAKKPSVGINNDNLYTPWTNRAPANAIDIWKGVQVASNLAPNSDTDAFVFP
jgi:prepilin-type N-terminal cleavage/methylation domain-containing protein